MKNLKNLNTTTMIALSLLLSTGVSSLTNQNQGGFVSTAYAASLTSGTTVKVTVSSSLHLRKEASSNSSSLAKLQNGTTLLVVSVTPSWAEVEVTSGTHKGKKGFVSLNYVDNGKWTETVGSEIKGDVYKVVDTTGGNLNVRANASSNSSIIGSLTRGTKVKIYAETNGWYKVKVGDAYGWSSKNYLVDPTDNNNNNAGTVSNDYGAIDITDKNVIFNANNVNARTGPGLSYSSKAKYNKGTQVKVTHQKTADGHTWYRISDNELWISKNYVDDVNASSGSGSTSSSNDKNNGGSGSTSSSNDKNNGGSGSTSSSSNSNKVTNKKAINKQVRPKQNYTKGYKEPNDALPTVNFTMNKNNIYKAVEEATVNGKKYYRIKALKTDLKVWRPASEFTDVTTSQLTLTKGKKYYLKSGTHFYKKSDLKNYVDNKYYAFKGDHVILNIISSNGTSVNVTAARKATGHGQGWINKGYLAGLATQSTQSADIEKVNVKDMFSDVYSLDHDDQLASAQSMSNSDDYLKITGTPSKPYIVQTDIDQSESDSFYVTQYFVDITSKDGNVTTLRFYPEDFNLIKALHSGEEITLYADPDSTEDAESLPMYAVGSDFIDSNSDSKADLYSHIAPLSDSDIVGIMIEDFTNLLSDYGITVEEFSQDDIEAIVKEINKPKFNQNSATIGGDENEDSKSESSKSNKNDSSISFGGMKSKFQF